MLIQVIHSTQNKRTIFLSPDLYRNSLVVRPWDSKWWLMGHAPLYNSTESGRMRRIFRGSSYYQLKPLQRNVTTWEIGTLADGRFFRLEVNSPYPSPRTMYVEITPLSPHQGNPVSSIAFEIYPFDFRTRITSEDGTKEPPEIKVETKVQRISRYERPPVI
jgi:hypothetical protein